MRTLLILLLLLTLSACQAAPTAVPTAVPSATMAVLPTSPAPAAAPLGLMVYDDFTGWENWSWDATGNPASAAQVYRGAAAFEITYLKASGGFSLRSAGSIDSADYSALVFWVIAPAGDQPLFVFTQSADDNSESAKASIIATSTWQEIRIPLSELGGEAPIKRISIQDDANGREDAAYPAAPFYLDDLHLEP